MKLKPRIISPIPGTHFDMTPSDREALNKVRERQRKIDGKRKESNFKEMIEKEMEARDEN